MISQADILKTLINKNCTDESVMSMALSPDCTPPKLLEKLTEAERFDLVLDLSMKLGLDVVPLWRTWAMRCLQNRNFDGARTKFRHCFQRLRLPGGRFSPLQSNLLTIILNELTRMDENPISLSEEIELIRHRAGPYSCHTNQAEQPLDVVQNVQCKPIILAECQHYLQEYGMAQDRIRFSIQNSLWKEAVIALVADANQINLDKFFIGEVFQYTTSTGHLRDMIQAFLKLDPTFTVTVKFFKAIYNFCSRNKRFNLLYYVQCFLGDYIGAANTQIYYFFLRKPVRSYNELNQRLTSLVNAQLNYQKYLEKMKQQYIQTPLANNSDHYHRKELTKEKESNEKSSQLFSTMTQNKVENQIKLLDLQIKITRNFGRNEVTGCMNGIKLGNTNTTRVIADTSSKNAYEIDIENKNNEVDDMPVTLFEKSLLRKTFLAALVLIYFDLSYYPTYFSKNGYNLAKQLINDFGLDKLLVFKTAMRIIMDDESCDILENARLLMERIKDDYMADHQDKRQLFVKVRRKCSSDSGTSSLASGSFSAAAVETQRVLGSPSSQPSSPEENGDGCGGFRAVCDEVVRDAIRSCQEQDYKMELAKLLSGEARIELYIEYGKLSNAQRLACNMNRADYVARIIKEAERLNQDHIKSVCELWLVKSNRNFG